MSVWCGLSVISISTLYLLATLKTTQLLRLFMAECVAAVHLQSLFWACHESSTSFTSSFTHLETRFSVCPNYQVNTFYIPIKSLQICFYAVFSLKTAAFTFGREVSGPYSTCDCKGKERVRVASATLVPRGTLCIALYSVKSYQVTLVGQIV